MASLTGQTIASTYDSLLKVSDNGPLTSTYKEIQDGFGNGSGLYLGTGGNVGIGTTSPDGAGGYSTLSINGSSGGQVTWQTSSSKKGYIYNTSSSLVVGADTGNNLIFDAGANERMRIATNGNVGIGTTSPNLKLEVFQANNNSSFLLRNGTTSSHNVLYAGNDSSTNSSFIGSYKGDDSFYSNLVLQKFGGNVGIGTTSPAYPLQVNGLISSNRTSNTDGGLVFGTPANGNYFYGADSGNYIAIYTNNGERMRITSAGNVGIGTTSPTAISGYTTLDVRGSNGSLLYMGTTSTSSLRLIGEGTDGYIDNLTAGGSLLFRTNNATERMRITSGGNVGIGTTSPQVTFHSYGGALTVGNEATYSARFSNNSNKGVLIGYDTTNNKGHIGSINPAVAWTDLILNANGGNVGIGTSSPSYTLHVNGSVAGTSAYVNLSDERYKKDIKPIENALDKILSLKGITFNWDKSNTDMNLDDANHIGLIAQDVEKVLPQVVTTGNDENSVKSVAYTDIVPVLIEAIKQQQAQIEELKAKIK